MKVACRLKSIDVSGATAKAAAANRRATIAMTEAARMDTLPYVPLVTGALARTADTESRPEKGLLIYGNSSVPYARAQYFGFPSKTIDAHPQASMQWFEQSKAANKADWRKVASDEYRSTMGGR